MEELFGFTITQLCREGESGGVDDFRGDSLAVVRILIIIADFDFVCGSEGLHESESGGLDGVFNSSTPGEFGEVGGFGDVAGNVLSDPFPGVAGSDVNNLGPVGSCFPESGELSVWEEFRINDEVEVRMPLTGFFVVGDFEGVDAAGNTIPPAFGSSQAGEGSFELCELVMKGIVV